jgi:hypothetical protein
MWSSTMIVALAGRRVDQQKQNPARFPVSSIEVVRERIRAAFVSLRASVLVSSAAAGSDLIALMEAKKLGMRRVVILPFERSEFRSTSVADRPADWGRFYDEVIDELHRLGDVVIAPVVAKDKAYVETNHLIVNKALSIASEARESVIAIQVWDGSSRGSKDVTGEFGKYATERGLQVLPLLTR